jgi:hypothetical protein
VPAVAPAADRPVDLIQDGHDGILRPADDAAAQGGGVPARRLVRTTPWDATPPVRPRSNVGRRRESAARPLNGRVAP